MNLTTCPNCGARLRRDPKKDAALINAAWLGGLGVLIAGGGDCLATASGIATSYREAYFWLNVARVGYVVIVLAAIIAIVIGLHNNRS